MNSKEEIIKIQNSEKMLKCQLAARLYFNCAEKFKILYIIVAFINFLFYFSPNNYYIISIILDILFFLFYHFASLSVENGEKLRNYFDWKVLDIIPEQFNKNEIDNIWELINAILKSHKDKYLIQLSNTGSDNPPGVKNWYEFYPNVEYPNPSFECQKQNAWWNNKLSKKRKFINFCVLIFVVTIIIIYLSKTSILKLLFCSLALIFSLIESIKENKKYEEISIKINHRIDTFNGSDSDLKILQNLICERRKIIVLESNIIHKLNSKKLSEDYKNKTNHDS